VISVLVLALAITAGRSETQLVLIDGQILSGVDVRRDESVYLLEQANGAVMTIPVEFVKEVRLLGDEKEDGFDPVTGLIYDKPQILAGEEPPDPGGVVTTGPQQLEGPEVNPVTPAEATAVFGEPAKFASDVIDPEWRPSSDWDMDPRNNDFAPSKWADNVVDPDWTPSSDWSNDIKQNEFAPSTWSESVIDSSWQPTDGFKGS
jgi:hypothetical protein